MWTRLRNYFLTGVVIAAPVAVTIWIVSSLIGWIDSWVRPLVPAAASPETYLNFTIPGFGVVVALVLITLIGFLAANLVGRTLLGFGERAVGRLPLVRALYKGVKQIIETVLADRSKTFQKVGLIQFPRKGLWATCLVATEAKGEIARILGADGEKVYCCVVPPSPVPTAGTMLFVRESEIIILDMSIEDAAKMIVSIGLVAPEYKGKVAELAVRQMEERERRRGKGSAAKKASPATEIEEIPTSEGEESEPPGPERAAR